MKVTKPSDMEDFSPFTLARIISSFEKQFVKENKGESYYHLVINEEISEPLCREVAIIYAEAGWRNVSCKTSSMNNERPGLTGLQLTRP